MTISTRTWFRALGSGFGKIVVDAAGFGLLLSLSFFCYSYHCKDEPRFTVLACALGVQSSQAQDRDFRVEAPSYDPRSPEKPLLHAQPQNVCRPITTKPHAPRLQCTSEVLKLFFSEQVLNVIYKLLPTTSLTATQDAEST